MGPFCYQCSVRSTGKTIGRGKRTIFKYEEPWQRLHWIPPPLYAYFESVQCESILLRPTISDTPSITAHLFPYISRHKRNLGQGAFFCCLFDGNCRPVGPLLINQ